MRRLKLHTINDFDNYIQYLCRISYWVEFTTELMIFHEEYENRLIEPVKKLGTVNVIEIGYNDTDKTGNEYCTEINFEQLLLNKLNEITQHPSKILPWGLNLNKKNEQLDFWIEELNNAINRVLKDDNYKPYTKYTECLGLIKAKLEGLRSELSTEIPEIHSTADKDFSKDARGINGHKNRILVDDAFFERAKAIQNGVGDYAFAKKNKKEGNPSDILLKRMVELNLTGFKSSDLDKNNPIRLTYSTIKRNLVDNKERWNN